ncbi:hypothetical protein WICPIJ_009727 [Wickerhamomyces pijperi]|uniref:Amino acid permease/ SLC12A domain-containing protein n=1 Tax=Wickerhamomyces pijperi TaxID=599730 RepID=A0A9P8TCM6_WICPI|nr:hypothetical protein WICPIJ_009727 [Wickerhamomyces pijperi]
MSITSQRTPLLSERPKTSFQSIPTNQNHHQPTRHDQSPPADKPSKLGTFDGVFIPTALNVLSILMFLRFGFIIGQLGILGSLGILLMSYLINALTTLSISAIATNGTVRGGGAYYMISRSLGVEFGGSIGLIFYIGQVLNSGLNVVGIIEPLLNNFGQNGGEFMEFLPSGAWFEFWYSTLLLFGCICIALIGSTLVSKCGGVLFVLLLIATISIPVSSVFVKPFIFKEYGLLYTGPTWDTVRSNLFPEFTQGAAGSLLPGKETFQDLFGIFFPATAGIFAGASMSGDLRKPSKSIPKGTICGLVLTFVCYALVILALGCCVPRELLRKDITIIQDVNLSAQLIFIGELSTSLFSIIVGIVGAAGVLQAIAKDSIFQFLKPFEKVTKESNNPINAILLTWLLTQLCLFANINQIATFITMAFLMTFIVTNLACFLLKIGSAPNFRPSFKYFNWFTALAGLASSFVAMFIVDGVSASLVVVFLILLFLLIHYLSPPKPWGDVSQSLIYHQVRKYLLRLRQDNVKYWRPQILLLVDDPRSSWNLIQFCNNLKKGGLYILGHVIVSESFQDNFDEFQKQTNAWIKLRDITKVKAFVQIGLGPSLQWGVRNVILGSGLGGMKPNIVVMGFLTNAQLQLALKHHVIYPAMRRSPSQSTKRQSSASYTALPMEKLPTDICRAESPISVQNWVSIIEDLILMRTNVAVAKGFEKLHIPSNQSDSLPLDQRPFIDLYPIQMSAAIGGKKSGSSTTTTATAMKMMTTNFDTYTLILQLGAILTTVPNWKRTHRLRIVLFVEDPQDMDNEQERIRSLIEILRIQAIVLVVCLRDFKTYNTIIKGSMEDFHHVDTVLRTDEFWCQLKELRASYNRMSVPDVGQSANSNAQAAALRQQRKSFSGVIGAAGAAGGKISDLLGDHGVSLAGTGASKRFGLGKLQQMGVSLTMTSNKFNNGLLHNSAYDDDLMDEDDTNYSGDVSDLESVSASPRAAAKLPFEDHKPTAHLFKEQYLPKLQSRPSESSYYAANTLSLRPDLHQTNSTLDIKSLKKKPVPNFSSEKLPRSKVIDDAMGDEPSIMLVPEDDELEHDDGSIASSRSRHNLNCKKKHSAVAAAGTSGGTSAASGGAGIKFMKKDDFNDSSTILPSPNITITQDQKSDQQEDNQQDEEDNDDEQDDDLIDITNLSFDDLPAKAQHLVLNDIMRTISKHSGVIFSTLPAPIIGTHRSQEESIEYVENLQVWCQGVDVPVMFINSQSMTVTAAL